MQHTGDYIYEYATNGAALIAYMHCLGNEGTMLSRLTARFDKIYLTLFARDCTWTARTQRTVGQVLTTIMHL